MPGGGEETRVNPLLTSLYDTVSSHCTLNLIKIHLYFPLRFGMANSLNNMFQGLIWSVTFPALVDLGFAGSLHI